MRPIIAAASAAAVLALLPSSATALAPCQPGNGTNHCYDIARLHRQVPAMVFSMQLQASGLPGGGAFATAEGWAVYNAAPEWQFGDWIEAGLMVVPSNENGDTRPHAFWATEHQGSLYVHEGPEPDNTITPPRHYFSISDDNGDGCYRIRRLLSSEVGGYYWKVTLATFCGRYPLILYGSTGGETMVGPEVRVWGRSESAWSNGEGGRYIGEWQPFEPVSYGQTSPEIGMTINPENPGPGNLEWHTAALPAASVRAASSVAPASSGTPGMTITQGKALTTKLKVTAPDGYKPTGTWKAVYRNSAGLIEDEYVGPSYPDEAKVRSGGQG